MVGSLASPEAGHHFTNTINQVINGIRIVSRGHQIPNVSIKPKAGVLVPSSHQSGVVCSAVVMKMASCLCSQVHWLFRTINHCNDLVADKADIELGELGRRRASACLRASVAVVPMYAGRGKPSPPLPDPTPCIIAYLQKWQCAQSSHHTAKASCCRQKADDPALEQVRRPAQVGAHKLQTSSAQLRCHPTRGPGRQQACWQESHQQATSYELPGASRASLFQQRTAVAGVHLQRGYLAP